MGTDDVPSTEKKSWSLSSVMGGVSRKIVPEDSTGKAATREERSTPPPPPPPPPTAVG